ncbi:MAG: hypothetical protein AAF740_11230 [Bacteroidota bacterium]
MQKFTFTKWLLLAALPILLTSCFEQQEEVVTQEINNTAGIEIYKPSHIEGEFAVNGTKIHYRAKADPNDLTEVQLAFQVGDKNIESIINYNTEYLLLDGHDQVLTQDEKDGLIAAALEVGDYINQAANAEEANVLHPEYALVRMMQYLGNAPTNHVFKKLEFAGLDAPEARHGNEGITCVKKGRTVRAEYDKGTNGQRYNEAVRVNSKPRSGYGCMGRCGADCGRWWIPSSWTKDCMDHDQCSNVFRASGGSGDSNCGDEFNEAADDWALGVARGCWG